MTILKSDIVGKPLNELPKSIIDSFSLLVSTNTPHSTWKGLSTKAVDFLSRCTLCNSTRYGATYKIDPTTELTIIHKNDTKYPISSYKSLLSMVITDYDEQLGATTAAIHDYCINTASINNDERYKIHKILIANNELVNSSVLNTSTDWKFIRFFKSGKHWDNSNSQEESSIEISIKDFITLFGKPQEETMSTKLQPGTHWERLEYQSDTSPQGEIITIEKITYFNDVYFNKDRSIPVEIFLERFKPRPDLDNNSSEPIKQELAFYKESDEPWTEEEVDNIRTYCNDTAKRHPMGENTIHRKYIYSHNKARYPDLKVYPWDDQTYPEGLEQVSYESIFGTPTKNTKQEIKPVAQTEPIQLITKETFMSKLKAVASTTVDQNKQALVIASKMEAGRIINKQVLKQLKPHLPFFLQGYASSPFAPFVAANLVTMVANHTQNSKLLKVSDLMLLGAADSGVASFNLNDIIEDILSKIKLPAGILDESDDE